jgi:hypothetical protein
VTREPLDRSPIGKVTQPRPIACERCGTPHERCIGHKRMPEGGVRPCGAWPVRGAEVCIAHGAAAPQVRAAAAARLVEAEARAAVATFGAPRQVDPGQALLEEVHRTAGHVAWLGSVVGGLEKDDVVWGVVEEVDRPLGESGGGLETKRKAVPNAWVQLYQAERQHLGRVAKAAIDAGVSERVVAVYEQIAASYVRVLEQVLDDLELTAGQRARVPQVVQGRLQAIAGGEAAS